MPNDDELQARLDSCDSEVRAFFNALDRKNAMLQKRIVKLEAERLSQKNKIVALEEECQKLRTQMQPVDSVDLEEAVRSSPALRSAMQRMLDKAARPKNAEKA